MKRRYKKDVLIARLVFLLFVLIVAAIVVSVAQRISSNRKARQESERAEAQQKQEELMEASEKDFENIIVETGNFGNEEKYVKTTSSVNLRSSASTSGDVITLLKSDTELQVLSESAGWVEVLYEGQTGYVNQDYVEEVVHENTGAEGGEGVTGEATYKSTTTDVNMRSGAGTDYDKIMGVEGGSQVKVLGESGDWSQVEFGGKTGYIKSEYLQ